MNISFKFVKLLLVMIIGMFMLVGSGGGGGSDTSASIETYTIKDGNHAIMGALKDAKVEVFKLDNLEVAIKEVQTDSLGRFDISLDDINDNELLLVKVSGGEDIDSNDDGIVDDTPTKNSGSIHALATTQELNNGKLNVTLLSEIVYQYTKHLINEVHNDDLQDSINEISGKLLKDNQTRTIKSSMSIINSFNPIDKNSQEILNFDYKSLIDGENSYLSLYHNNSDKSKVEGKLKELFKSISLNNMRLIEDSKYSKIILEEPINSTITSNNNIYIDLDKNSSNLRDFILKGQEAKFKIDIAEDMKVVGWEGCDKVSKDFKECSIIAHNNFYRVVPTVIYKETKYADNVRDITEYHIDINNTNYTITLDDSDEVAKEYISDIQVDNIIISSNPNNPFFRKVINSTRVDDNHYVFDTTPVSFLELYDKGSVFTNRNLTHEDLVAQNGSRDKRSIYRSRDGIRLLPPKHKNDDEFVIVFGEDKSRSNDTFTISKKINDYVSVKGSLSFKLKPQFDYNIEWFDLKSMRFVMTSTITSKLVIEVSAPVMEDTTAEILLGTLANFKFAVGPIPIEIELQESLFFEGKAESSIAIGGEYGLSTKAGFNYVNGNLVGISKFSGDGQMIGELKPLQFSLFGGLKTSPIILIGGIAGVELETKLGFYGEVAPLVISSSYNDNKVDIDKDLSFSGKVDVLFSADLKWAWRDYIEDFSWASKFSKLINNKLASAGLGMSYSKNLFEWSSQEFEQPAYLKLTNKDNLSTLKYSNENIDKHYIFNIKNSGEQDLKWEIEKTRTVSFDKDLSNDISISPLNGVLKEGEDIDIDVFLQKNSLSSSIGKNSMYIYFKNLSDTTSSNLKTGTTYKTIELEVLKNIDKPSNLNVNLVGNDIKKLDFSWTPSIDDIDGYILYKTDYNTETNKCFDSYTALLNSKTTTSGIFLKEYQNNQNQLLNMEYNKKYCFKVSAFKGGLFNSLNESELSDEVVLDLEEVNIPITPEVEVTTGKWMETSSEKMNWDGAMEYCRDNGGRLPTIEELKKVVTDCGGINRTFDDSDSDIKNSIEKNEANKFYKPCYELKGFTSNMFYWSSTNGFVEDNAWIFAFYFGSVRSAKYLDHYARCIAND